MADIRIENSRDIAISNSTFGSAEVSNSSNIDFVDNSYPNERRSNSRFSAGGSKKTTMLPLSKGPLRGSQSRPIPAICSNPRCQHAYLSHIRLQQSTRVTTRRTQSGRCLLCGSDGYTLDGVYNQIAEEFTVMLFDGITKEQLEAMERVVGLAISTGEFDKAKDDLIAIAPGWKNAFGMLESNDVGAAFAIYTFFLTLILGAIGIWQNSNDDERQAAPEITKIEVIDNSTTIYVSPEFAEQVSNLKENKKLPKPKKPSAEK